MDVVAWQPVVLLAPYTRLAGGKAKPRVHLGLRGWLRCPVCKTEFEELHTGELTRGHLRISSDPFADVAKSLKFEAKDRLCHGSKGCEECGVVSIVPPRQLEKLLESLPDGESWLEWVLDAITQLKVSDLPSSRRAPSPDDSTYEVTLLEGSIKSAGQEVCWPRITMSELDPLG